MTVGVTGFRIARAAKCAAAAIALLAFALPAAAQHGGPRITYSGYPADERLAIDGLPAQSADEREYELSLRDEVNRVRATQDYEPMPAIWRISDADTTIYMFGTIHSLPHGFRWRNPGLEAVIVRADLLLLESTEEDGEEVSFAPPATGEPLPPLLDRVSHRYRAKLAALQALLPTETVALLDTMPTWLASISIGAVREALAGQMATAGADDWLERHFRAIGRPVEAIEDSQQVVTNLNAVPERAQRQMLEIAIGAPISERAEREYPAHAWARGEVGADSPLIINPTDLDPSSEMAVPLLDDRNAAWVDDLIRRLNEHDGVILFAAGAGHFVGPGSVIERLESRGVRVERVQ